MNKIKLNGTIYMKNGTIINESTEAEGTQEDAEEFVKQLRDNIETMFKKNLSGDFTLGDTIFRFSEIAAIKLVLE